MLQMIIYFFGSVFQNFHQLVFHTIIQGYFPPVQYLHAIVVRYIIICMCTHYISCLNAIDVCTQDWHQNLCKVLSPMSNGGYIFFPCIMVAYGGNTQQKKEGISKLCESQYFAKKEKEEYIGEKYMRENILNNKERCLGIHTTRHK